MPRRRRLPTEAVARAAKAVRPELTEHRKKAINAGTSAIIGLGASLGIAAAAGLVGGRLHPVAPQILYTLFASVIGFVVVEKNQAMGNTLLVGGMLNGAQLVLRGVAVLLSNGAATDVPSNPFDVAQRVAQAVSQSPTPSPTLAPATDAPTAAPTVLAVAPTSSPRLSRQPA